VTSAQGLLEVARQGKPPRLTTVDSTPFRIGSGAGAQLRIADPGILPSHLQLLRLGGAFHLVPDPAAPPVSVDGVPLPAKGMKLSHGARITIGGLNDVHLRFLLTGEVTRDRDARLIALMEIARTITSGLTHDEVSRRVLEGAIRFSGAERGFLFLREGERLVPWSPDGGTTPEIEVSLSVAEQVACSGRPVYKDHLRAQPGRPTSSIVRLGLQAILCVPLTVRQDVIGVIYLDSQRDLPHHRPDLPLLEALAGLAAIAIQNARLVESRLQAERTMAIGQMARVIVHDLRSPMTSIRGLAELLLRRSGPDDPARKHLSTIVAEADRLSGLTDDLLQFTREGTSGSRSIVRLSDVVQQTLAPLRERLERCRVEVTQSLDDEAHLSVDRDRLVRAIHNLLSNSLDAMPDGGTLFVGCARSGARCILSVRDSGCGMERSVRERIFDPFYTHDKRNGTGLGLAIVRAVVEEHQGSIRVESAPGKGTTVFVDLPGCGAAEATPPRSDAIDRAAG
jgi:signal transduction histidine kinase